MYQYITQERYSLKFIIMTSYDKEKSQFTVNCIICLSECPCCLQGITNVPFVRAPMYNSYIRRKQRVNNVEITPCHEVTIDRISFYGTRITWNDWLSFQSIFHVSAILTAIILRVRLIDGVRNDF